MEMRRGNLQEAFYYTRFVPDSTMSNGETLTGRVGWMDSPQPPIPRLIYGILGKKKPHLLLFLVETLHA
jgi:hypothetical protein